MFYYIILQHFFRAEQLVFSRYLKQRIIDSVFSIKTKNKIFKALESNEGYKTTMYVVRTQFESLAQRIKEIGPKKPNIMNL